MARYSVKENVYGKNGLLSHERVLKEFTDLKEARKYAYRHVQGREEKVVNLYQFTSDKTPLKRIGFVIYRDFGNLYPYGKWTFIDYKDEHRMLNPDGTINRKSEYNIAMERKTNTMLRTTRKK